jgi:hypothetical protein
MLLGAPPLKITLPFANSGSKRVIPEASQIAITPGAASLTDGFPPLTATAIASGGIAPDVKDFNGMLNELSAAVRWHAAGAGYVYDSTFASNTNVAGYPAGARVLRTDGKGYWVNTTDANTTNPESGGAGWLPDFVTGAASIAVSNTTVTLTSLQAGFPIIVLSGTITANLNVILPAYVKGWHIINSATGAFSVTVKTTAGTGVVLPSGSQAFVYGDGTNIVQLASNQIDLVLNTLTVSGASALNGGATTPALTSPLDSSTKIPNSAFVFGTQADVQGSFSSLKISSLGLTNFTSAITAGSVVLRNATGQSFLASAVSVSPVISASGANGLDTGTLAASTFYYPYVIYNPTTLATAGLFSLSATAPTLPSGYTFFARIGAVRTDSSGSKYLLQMLQYGRRVQYVVLASSNTPNMPTMASGSAGNTSTPTWVAVSVSAYVPAVAGRISGSIFTNTLGGQVIVAPNNSYSGYNSVTNPAPTSSSAASNSTANIAAYDFALESTSIYWAANGTGILTCLGWEDNL